MFEISGLSISYGSVEVVHGVSMRVDERQIVALIGPNGAGKSSVLKAVSGLIRPTAGDIVFLGASLIGVPPHEIAAAGVAHVMEGRHLFGGLSVEDNLLLAGSNDEKDSAGNVEAVYQRWPRLRERREQLAGTLSGGEQQMLAIGRALMTRPRLLMLDEPSWGLAPLIVRDLMRTFTGLRDQGMTILLVEQMANLALKICDYAYVMTTGRVVLEGSSEELLSNPDLKATYLGGEMVSDARGAARFQRKEVQLPQPAPVPERLPKESPGQPRAMADQSPDPLTPLSIPPETTDIGVPGRGAFAERERSRQLRQQAFLTSKSSADLRKDMMSLRQDVSTLKADRTETEGSFRAAPGKNDVQGREKVRLEKEAALASHRGMHALNEPGAVPSGSDSRVRETARRKRQTELSVQSSIPGDREQPMWVRQEQQRKQRQREMEESGASVEVPSVGLAPSGRKDRRMFEHQRREREKSFASGTGTRPALDRAGSAPEDYAGREQARRHSQAAMEQAGKRSEPES